MKWERLYHYLRCRCIWLIFVIKL